MTRVLSELLGAREPAFQQGLQRLERASGRMGADIRLSLELERATRLKLKELGLDPQNTTGEELYHALQEKVRSDDARLTASLRKTYGDQPAHLHIAKAIADLPIHKQCFALKTTASKRLLQKFRPKQTMRMLGYRSFDSMLRREQLLTVLAASWLLESATWRKSMVDEYKRLKPADFEIRAITILSPHSPHWQALADSVVAQKKHNVISLRESGALIILPLPQSQPPAATFASLLIALHDLNEVRASSTYLKLSQVRADFGTCVQAAVLGDPSLQVDMLDGRVSWHVIQRYYARFTDRFREELFEPHVQKEDLSWHSVEKALSHIEPSLTFWHHTGTLGLHDQRKPVSLNVIDAALNFCNQLSYKNRIVTHFRSSLWGELVMRYLKHDSVEQAVVGGLESKLVRPPSEPTEEEFDTV